MSPYKQTRRENLADISFQVLVSPFDWRLFIRLDKVTRTFSFSIGPVYVAFAWWGDYD